MYYALFIFVIVSNTHSDQYLLKGICDVLSVARTRDMIVRFSLWDTEFSWGVWGVVGSMPTALLPMDAISCLLKKFIRVIASHAGGSMAKVAFHFGHRFLYVIGDLPFRFHLVYNSHSGVEFGKCQGVLVFGRRLPKWASFVSGDRVSWGWACCVAGMGRPLEMAHRALLVIHRGWASTQGVWKSQLC